MKIHLPYICIIILLVVVYFLDSKNQRLKREKNLKTNHDLQLKLDSTESELRSTRKLRDSLNLLIADLHSHSQALSAKLEAADKKLKNIPGKFDKLNNIELENEMIERWRKGR